MDISLYGRMTGETLQLLDTSQRRCSDEYTFEQRRDAVFAAKTNEQYGV